VKLTIQQKQRQQGHHPQEQGQTKLDIYIYIYIYRCTCSVRREPILVVDALVSFFESKRQHFFFLFARRV
jgi:hypothetical protein